MAYNAFAGSFNIDSSVTAGNDQAVSGVGFQPKVVLFWWGGSTSSVDSVSGATINIGFGAASSSSSRWCAMGISEDAQADSDNLRSHSITECIRCYTDTGTLDGIADFSSMDADGFTLTIDDQFTQDYRISYLALGGSDLTDVYLGNYQTPAATGNHNITGVGFQPDAVLFASSWYAGTSGSTTHSYFSVGWSTASDEQGTVYQGGVDNQATSYTFGYGYNGECISGRAVTLAIRESFVSFGADGFTLNALEASVQRHVFYVCWRGGQYEVGELTTRTDGNDIEEDLSGAFEPVAVLFGSANRAHSTQDTVTDHARMSIGAATATDERTVQAISDEDNLADTETAYTNQDDAVYAHVVDDAIEALMDIKSFDADGFTCVMDDTETSACWVTYLAIGAEAAAGETLSIAIVPTDSSYDVAKPIIVG